MKRLWFLIPLAAFLALAVVLAVGLKLDPREVPSPLIDKPAPKFALPRLDDAAQDDPPRRPARQGLDAQRLGLVVRRLPRGASAAGRVREEARRADLRPQLQGQRDRTRSAWLARFGNPYDASLFDDDGRVGIDFGVYGVPETFVIDGNGVIRLKHIGPITPEVLANKIEPLLKKLDA